jgi:hypothetical protein
MRPYIPAYLTTVVHCEAVSLRIIILAKMHHSESQVSKFSSDKTGPTTAKKRAEKHKLISPRGMTESKYPTVIGRLSGYYREASY